MGDVSALIAQNSGNGGGWETILWIVAAVLVIAGVVTAIRGSVVAGVVLVVVGLLIGPGGVSLLS